MCIASVVVRPGLPPKRCGGSSWNISARYERCSATIAVNTFHIVFSSAIGLYALGMSYLGLPGLWRTIMLKLFQGLNWRLRSSMAVYMCSSLSVSRLAHLVNTMFGMLSGPGALYGLSFLS